MQNEIMLEVRAKKGLTLDPRTKIILMLVANIPAFTTDKWYVLALTVTIPLSLMIFAKMYRVVAICAVLYTLSILADTVLRSMSVGFASVVVGLLAGIILRMLPGILMGYFLLTTTMVSEFVAAMERIHMPKAIIIPFSVMFRFFPTIKEEASAITDAMKMRGVSLGKTRGGIISLMEYRIVPLFISCVKIGDELSSSALTRGLGSPVKRTNICQIGFHIVDIIYLAFALVTMVLFMCGGGGNLW